MNAQTPHITNRRQLLLGLAAASTAALANSPAGAGVSENPELLRLADELPAILARYVAARNKAVDIYRDTHAKWPRAPAEICKYWSGKIERDVSGAAIIWPDQAEAKYVGTPVAFQNVANTHAFEIARISKFKRVSSRRLNWQEEQKVKALAAIPIAEIYWREVNRLEKVSGYDEAASARDRLMEKLRAHVSNVMKLPEKSMTGLVVKAQALKAWGEVDYFYRCLNTKADDWANEIASAIIRQGMCV